MDPTSFVCGKCLQDHSHNIRLIENFCFTKADHGEIQQQYSGKVLVVWNGEKRCLEPVSAAAPFIRPVPKLPYMTGGFKMCDGILCKGKHCTYAHSIEEKIAWNAQRFRNIDLSTGKTTQNYNRPTYGAELSHLARTPKHAMHSTDHCSEIHTKKNLPNC